MKICNRKLSNVTLLFFIICQLLSANLFASGTGTTTASFLKIAVGARNIAMGETGATSEDVNSIYWNPSGLAAVNDLEISLMHAIWLETISYEHLACVFPTKYGNLGGAINYLSMSEMDKYDNTGTKQQEKMTANDLALTFSYNRKVLVKEGLPFLNIGFNMKYLQSNLEKETANAFATDIGFQTTLKKPQIKFGLVFQNIGTEMKFIKESFSLPMNIKFGTGYSFLIKNNPLNLLLDINFPNDNDLKVNFGVEYEIDCGKKIKVSPRFGYLTYNKGLEDTSGIVGGLGFTFRDYSIDYAYVPYGQLGDTHRISLILKFFNR